MAVAFDAVGPSSAGAGNLAASTLSWSHTCAPGAVLLVGVALGAHTSDSGMSVVCSYGGTNMTSLAGPVHANAGTQGFLQVFGVLNPHAGANTVLVTASGATPTSLAGGSISLTGAGAFNTPTTATGSSTTASVTDAANTVGNMIVAFTGAGSGLSSATSPLTSAFIINEDANSGAGNCAGGYVAAPGSSQATAWTISAFDFWAAINVEVQVAPPLNNPIFPSQQIGRLQVRLRKSRQIQQFNVQSPDATAFPVTVTATTSIPVPGGISPPFLASVTGSGQALYFQDQHGSPYLLRWDTAWDLIVNAGNSAGATTWQTDMAGYCAARAGLGFNGFLTTPTANSNIPGAPFSNGNTWDGVAPFTSPGVLNNTFWARVDYLLAQAASYGMTVVLNAAFTYSIFNAGPLNGWTSGQFQNYGAAVGARYAATANLVWEVGDDYGGSWDGGLNGFDTQFNSFLTGLRGAGANQMISVENMSEGSSRYSIDGATTYAWGVANASWDWVYSYDVAYTAVENAYTEAAAHSVASICVCKMDGVYDNQLNGATFTETVELYWRKWIWWTLTAGSRGVMYGQNELYQWPVNALSSGLAGSSPGSQYMQPSALKTALDTFASFTGWNLLVPDTSSALVTAGRGTRSNGAFGTGAGTAGPGSMYLGGNTYVTASITPSGSLAVIYIPSNVTITVNGALMQAGYTATWVDPASGAQTAATIAATYSHAAANSAGDHDWVLVLQAQPPAAPPAPALTPPLPLPPGWFPGADSRVTAEPGGIPFYVVPQPAATVPAAGVTFTGTAAAAGAAATTAVATQIAPATAAGAGAAAAVVTQIAPATPAGAGAVAALATQIAPATSAGAGSVTDVATQAATGTAAGAAAVTDVVTQAATGTAAGAAAETALAAQVAIATATAAGSVTDVVTQIAPATAAGAGSVTDVVTQIAPATSAGAAAVTDVVTLIAPAAAAGAGSVTAAGASSGASVPEAAAPLLPLLPPGWFPGSGPVTALPGGIPFYVQPQPADQNAPAGAVTFTGTASAAGAAAVTAAVTQDAGTSTTAVGAAAAAAVATQIAPASAAGAGAVTDVVTQIAPATSAGAAVIADVVTQIATATAAGAAAVTAVGASSGAATGTAVGAAAVTDVVTQIAPAAAAGAAAVTDVVTQIAKATAAGAGAVNASGVIPGTASVAGAASATATAAQAATAQAAAAGTLAALAAQRATATLTAAGSVTAAGAVQLAFTVGTLTATAQPAAVLTAAAAPGGSAGGTLTASATRTGGPGG